MEGPGRWPGAAVCGSVFADAPAMPGRILMSGHSDPPKAEREWFSHKQSGDRGYKVIREGKEHIRLDRPMEEITYPFNPSMWDPDEQYRPMSVAQIAQVAFEADRKLCFWLGVPDQSKKEWASLTDKQRQFWMTEGPKQTQRKELYAGIFASQRPFFR